MNIFAAYPGPFRSAKILDLKRVNKMIVESTQLMHNSIRYHMETGENTNIKELSTIFETHPDIKFYKETHKNHPCSIWARNFYNFTWLFYHTSGLLTEYTENYGKIHACKYFMSNAYQMLSSNLEIGGKYVYRMQNINFVNCTEFKDVQNVHKAYRMQMVKKWFTTDKRIPAWSKNSPKWLKNINITRVENPNKFLKTMELFIEKEKGLEDTDPDLIEL